MIIIEPGDVVIGIGKRGNALGVFGVKSVYIFKFETSPSVSKS